MRFRRTRERQSEPERPGGERAGAAPTGADATTGGTPTGHQSAPASRSTAARPADGRQGEAPRRARRRGVGETRRRGAGETATGVVGAAAGAAGSGALALARLVMALAGLIALLIVLAIVLRDVNANAGNTIVKGIHEGANFFAGSFTGLLGFSGHPKRALTVDWGIAAIVYLLVGALVAGFIARIGRGGLRFRQAHLTT